MVFPELLISINLGDSRAILCNIEVEDGKAISKTAIELSTDHKPFRESEKERVLKCGGKIERAKGKYDDKEVGPLRVWLKDEESPGIAITRSIGDLIAHTIGVISDPEITFRFREQGDKFIVLGSDGVWDVMSSAEAVGLVLNCETREESANKLVEECKVRWNLLNEVKLQQSRAILESSETNQKKINEKLEALKKSMVRDDITAIVMFL
jgi:integrin-linked kinase-associated serine/threonine phosphatase 2C